MEGCISSHFLCMGSISSGSALRRKLGTRHEIEGAEGLGPVGGIAWTKPLPVAGCQGLCLLFVQLLRCNWQACV